jgi:hypothetical protein
MLSVETLLRHKRVNISITVIGEADEDELFIEMAPNKLTY